MLLSTQFEATDARRMFPCWDEPAFRATFALTATTPSKWKALSNMPVASSTQHGATVESRLYRARQPFRDRLKTGWIKLTSRHIASPLLAGVMSRF